jgi:predicted alpha-1,2-mannosidase
MSGILLVCAPVVARSQSVDWVNEYIGTANQGQTFPSTAPPFAMTQWTPQTREGNVKCIAPYYFSDERIQGFRGSHFLSGSCTRDYGSMTLMPESGALKLDAAERGSRFNRAEETATPYRYAANLSDYGIAVEMSGTTRSGILRFRFDRGGRSWILAEANSAKGDGSVQIDPKQNEIRVVSPARRLYAGAGKLAGFSGYFVVRFDHRFKVGGTWAGAQRKPGGRNQEGVEGAPGAYVLFDVKPGETVQAKVGSSFTSLDEARLNLEHEIPGWDFAGVVEQAKAAWNQELSEIEIDAPATQKRIFYSALYHSLQLPRIFSDVDGSYPRFAGGGFTAEGRIETARGFVYYCDFSLWDTFRALHPLLTILDPDRERDMVKSLIVKGQQGGFLPIYPAWNSYTSEMIGDHADSVIADAWFKGIRGFDMEEAYRLMRKNATELPASFDDYVDGRGRRGLNSYLKFGYIPLEDPVKEGTPSHPGEQVSRTLEYAYDDAVVGEVAQALGHSADAEMFRNRAQNYRNVIDAQTGFARGRHEDGSWDSPFDPAKPYKYITEGLPYQYTFFVPQDLPGLIGLVGGREAFIGKLDTLFARGHYDHGNEPSHHIAYLYNSVGAAWKTQQHVRELMDTQYADSPGGLAGNDDAGQMSAWYVMSALGFYPVNPGTPIYEIGTPRFDDAAILLPGGKRFHIRAEGAAAGKQYIRSVTLNGIPLNRSWIRHAEILYGGELVFEMTSDPNPGWPTE